MKNLIKKGIILIFLLVPAIVFAQLPTFDQVKQAALDSLTSPNFLNDAMAKFMAALDKKDTSAYNFIRNLNLDFKTFQADNQPPGLGFSYQYDNSWTKNSVNKTHDISQSFNLNLDGNVAFKKVYNPTNFLESKFVYNGTFFWGGLAKKNTPEEAKQLRDLFRSYATAVSSHDETAKQALKARADQLTQLTDQFYIGINGSASFESNQDFSKTQFVPGLLINAGASSFTDKSALSWFNFPDYPFALIRLLTQTNSHFSVSGVAIPSVLFGLDYVVPTNDSLRQAVTGALNPFTRIRFEASFKTEAAKVAGQVFWFSADYRWYHQLGASEAIINAHINNFSFFTCNLAASNGFFVSYSTGQLPFDQKSANVYGLGFKYNLGNWKKGQ